MKIVVLGAGVIGVTSAWYLARAGHEVTVVDRQPAAAMERLSAGVITAIPAIEPVERKKSAIPRRRMNQWLMTGVSATGLVNASPSDRKTPKASRKLTGSRA